MAIAVLALLVGLIAQLFINTTTVSSISSNHMESDARVRQLFARMAADFSHILKRKDIDYYLKSPANPQTTPNNDQLAFFSEVSGYSDVSGVEQNSVSLVAYRVNPTGTAPCIERLGKALSWSAGTAGIFPVAFLPVTIAGTWAPATLAPSSAGTSDPAYDQDYETLVPNAFRFEYYYQLHTGALSATPWYDATNKAPDGSVHTSVSGLADVAGIGLVVAVTDRKAGALVSAAALQTLGGQLADFSSSITSVGALQQQWQNTIASSSLTAPIKSGIRVYEQVISINTPSQ